jgi:epsin
MDFNSLKDAVSNLTLYDVKAGVRKVQNGRQTAPGPRPAGQHADLPRSRNELHGDGVKGVWVFLHLAALSLTHGQVREATNNEPWGASSTLMQEIANGTFN